MEFAELRNRHAQAEAIARDAGQKALDYFNSFATLSVENKGHQDFVSEADRNVEIFIREALDTAFPDDGIIGEEHAAKQGTSGFTWVLDPIDGTANFVNGIPAWTVVIAGVFGENTEIGVIFDPVHDDMYSVLRGSGAQLNNAPHAGGR